MLLFLLLVTVQFKVKLGSLHKLDSLKKYQNIQLAQIDAKIFAVADQWQNSVVTRNLVVLDQQFNILSTEILNQDPNQYKVMIKAGTNYIYILEDHSSQQFLSVFDTSMNKQQEQTASGLYLSNHINQQDQLLQLSKQLNILMYDYRQFLISKQVSSQTISQNLVPQVSSDNQYVYTLFAIEQNQKYQLIVDKQNSNLEDQNTQQITICDGIAQIQQMKLISAKYHLLAVYSYKFSDNNYVLSYTVYDKQQAKLVKYEKNMYAELVRQIELYRIDDQQVSIAIVYQQSGYGKVVQQIFSFLELKVQHDFDIFRNINVKQLKLVCQFGDLVTIVQDENGQLYKQKIMMESKGDRKNGRSRNVLGIVIVGIGVSVFIGILVLVWFKKYKMRKIAQKNIMKMDSRPRSAHGDQTKRVQLKRPMTSGMVKKSLQKKDIDELKKFKDYNIQKRLNQMSQNNSLTFMQKKEQQVLETENFIKNESANYDDDFIKQIEDEIELEIQIKNQKRIIEQNQTKYMKNNNLFIIQTENNADNKSQYEVQSQNSQNHHNRLESNLKHEENVYQQITQKQDTEQYNSEYRLESNIQNSEQRMQDKMFTNEEQQMMEGISEFDENCNVKEKYDRKNQNYVLKENMVDSDESQKSVKINNQNIENIIQVSQVVDD